jgi:hypothetical protein
MGNSDSRPKRLARPFTPDFRNKSFTLPCSPVRSRIWASENLRCLDSSLSGAAAVGAVAGAASSSSSLLSSSTVTVLACAFAFKTSAGVRAVGIKPDILAGSADFLNSLTATKNAPVYASAFDLGTFACSSRAVSAGSASIQKIPRCFTVGSASCANALTPLTSMGLPPDRFVSLFFKIPPFTTPYFSGTPIPFTNMRPFISSSEMPTSPVPSSAGIKPPPQPSASSPPSYAEPSELYPP